MMERSASAVWHGDLKQGTGSLTTQSHALNNTPYSFHTRFEDSPGTNPEELIAAAHAGCFTMALSSQLSSAGHPPATLETTATVIMETTDDGPTVTKIHLSTQATVVGIDKDVFVDLAKKAKEGCPMSRLLKAAEITMEATLL
jgi:osmotically inducible protein OsmC